MSAWYLEPWGAFPPRAVVESGECLCRSTEPDVAHTALYRARMAHLSFQPLLSDTKLAVTWWHHRKTLRWGRGSRVLQFMQGFALERETERKTGWWGLVWYSVSLVHPGRYDFRKSKTIYQYPLNPISSFSSRSCKEKMWRAMRNRFMAQIYSCISLIFHTRISSLKAL